MVCPVNSISAAMEREAFLREWCPRSEVLAWNPVWTYTRKSKPPAVIDFMTITDPRRLRRLSALCERQYLGNIETARRAWVETCRKRGIAEVQAKLEFERELAKADLYYLAKYILRYDRMRFHLHYFMASTMDNLPPGYRGLREFPRDSYKTTVMTISFMVQQVLRNREVRILLKSNAAGNAKKKLEEAKAHFFPSPEGTPARRRAILPMLFPELAPKKETDKGSGEYYRCPAATSVQADGTFVAAGVGSSKVSQHFDIVIGDDFWDEKSVTRQDQVEKVNKELDSIEYLLISPAEGRVIVIGTRFSFTDPTERLRASFHSVIVSGVTPAGRSLFPESLPLENFIRQANTNLYVFSCQVMLSPRQKDAGFRREWLHYLKYTDIRRAELANQLTTRRIIQVDSSCTGDETSDEIAVLVTVVDSLGRKTIVDAVSEKMSPDRYIQVIANMWDKWSPEFIVRQKTSIDTTIQAFLRELNERRDREHKSRMRFYDYSLGKREKKDRITQSLQPRGQNAELYVDPTLPELAAIETEWNEHPTTHRDHILDAWATLDDGVVSRVPEHRDAVETPVDALVPRAQPPEELAATQAEWRHSQIKEIYAQRRGLARNAQRPVRPGTMARE